jgi:hypothetical protein
VIGVEDEGDVQRAGRLLIRLLAEQHRQEVRRVRKLRVGRHDLLPRPQPVIHRDVTGDLGDEAQCLAVVGLLGAVPAVGVVGRGGRDARPEHRHRGGLLRERRHEVVVERRRIASLDEELVQVVEVGLGRESQVVQEVDHLLVGGLAREIVDVVAGVPEPALLAVDVGDAGLRGDDLSKSHLAHAVPLA